MNPSTILAIRRTHGYDPEKEAQTVGEFSSRSAKLAHDKRVAGIESSTVRSMSAVKQTIDDLSVDADPTKETELEFLRALMDLTDALKYGNETPMDYFLRANLAIEELKSFFSSTEPALLVKYYFGFDNVDMVIAGTGPDISNPTVAKLPDGGFVMRCDHKLQDGASSLPLYLPLLSADSEQGAQISDMFAMVMRSSPGQPHTPLKVISGREDLQNYLQKIREVDLPGYCMSRYHLDPHLNGNALLETGISREQAITIGNSIVEVIVKEALRPQLASEDDQISIERKLGELLYELMTSTLSQRAEHAHWREITDLYLHNSDFRIALSGVDIILHERVFNELIANSINRALSSCSVETPIGSVRLGITPQELKINNFIAYFADRLDLRVDETMRRTTTR